MAGKSSLPKCECGSGKTPTFACMGQRWCSACVDGTDDRPSMQDVYDSPAAQAARASHDDRPTTTEQETPTMSQAAPPEGFVTRTQPWGSTTTVRATPTARAVRMPSPKSVAFLRSLLAEREGVPEAEAIRDEINALRTTAPGLSQRDVSQAIDRLKRVVKPRTTTKAPGQPQIERQTGDVHVIDGCYYRIHESQTTGAHYACKFDPESRKFEYERGAIRLCTPANKATAEQAAAFGHLYHQCVFCARRLDTPESTAAGYGPVCADKHGLPWG